MVGLWLQPLSGLGTSGEPQPEIVQVLHFHPELGVVWLEGFLHERIPLAWDQSGFPISRELPSDSRLHCNELIKLKTRWIQSGSLLVV